MGRGVGLERASDDNNKIDLESSILSDAILERRECMTLGGGGKDLRRPRKLRNQNVRKGREGRGDEMGKKGPGNRPQLQLLQFLRLPPPLPRGSNPEKMPRNIAEGNNDCYDSGNVLPGMY